MNTIIYETPKPGDEYQISDCMHASADLLELVGDARESIAEWKEISAPKELRERILSREKTLIAIWDDTIVGFIAFRRSNHLSLLFVRKDCSGKGIGRELFTRCIQEFSEVTVNSADTAIGFYQKMGFVQCRARFYQSGIYATPMRWTKPTMN
ncbi:GNAT family N-acetyltransferase [Leptothoe spongobia TAU-MAC 1115]|uniref:GNAT family N-acetyltransferase n=1 Tax=Leptothoe spongobia TAU-MAC 1115 TaxID=1967444 RepID=A0A947GIC6_9CYAN|nr:GNAT family N-acetyltransferase [Leptothoe spongobia TAU-MAC 1115]